MTWNSYRIIPNLSYTGHAGGGLRQQLDVYLPSESPRAVPLVVVVHGGGWCSGDKGALGAEAHFLDHGFGVARINYRYSTQAPHPAQLEDVRAAVRFLKGNAAELGVDPQRFTAIGHSAGGHLVSLLACTSFQAPGTGVCGVVNQAGPTDFPGLARTRTAPPGDDPDASPMGLVEGLLGHPIGDNPENARLASPIAYVDATHRPCPHLLVYGGDDSIVPASQGERFHAQMRKTGGKSSLHIIPQAGHVDPRFWQEENLERVREFFDQVTNRV